MLRPFGHPGACCCVLVGLLAQSLKPVKQTKKKYGCVALRVVQIVIIKTTEVQISRLSQMTCTEPPLLIAYSNVVFTG